MQNMSLSNKVRSRYVKTLCKSCSVTVEVYRHCEQLFQANQLDLASENKSYFSLGCHHKGDTYLHL